MITYVARFVVVAPKTVYVQGVLPRIYSMPSCTELKPHSSSSLQGQAPHLSYGPWRSDNREQFISAIIYPHSLTQGPGRERQRSNSSISAQVNYVLIRQVAD